MAENILDDSTVEKLEDKLDCLNPETRKQALDELAGRVAQGRISLPSTSNLVNLHYHTFFSFNANGWSPSRIAWEARKRGLAVAGIVDFDVLDGMDEFLAAGDTVGLRAVAALETRVFIGEYADSVINSPNEPGVAYFMAAGCYRAPQPGSRAEEILLSMRRMARERNMGVLERVNDYLDSVQLDYDSDVLPLTPSGNATERHLLAAYDAKSRQIYADVGELATFWSAKLDLPAAQTAALLDDPPALHEKMRSKLMKFGGVGYVAPAPDTFPSVETVIEMTNGMSALPTATWLDGINTGESDMPAMLELLASKGVVALNIIPDRNWNIKDPDEKRVKLDNLRKVVEAARAVDFPLSVGTEMNKAGLPFVDDFGAPELEPFVEDFVSGAYFFWGHTLLARSANVGFASDWARSHFGTDRAAKNRFFEQVGRAADAASGTDRACKLNAASLDPAAVLRALQ